MIQVENLTKSFGKDKIAVNNTSWTADDGEITGFIGPNGAGKTTTLKMITGISSPDKGRVLINGFDIADEPLKAKQQFGYVSDSPDHFLRLKGIEYLNFISDVYGVDTEQRISFIDDVSKKFGIADALNKNIFSYSHGMRQKIMVMGALIHDPSVWILDEPLTGLDPQAAFEIKQMMRAHVSQGKTVLFSTHVLEVAEKLCDKVIIINHGQIKFKGSLEELKKNYQSDMSLEEIFLDLTGDKNE